jgi:hypothetical protein
MKKIDGAEPGWYDDPEIGGKERYWNGNAWEELTRSNDDAVSNSLEANEIYLGRLFFRRPLERDKAFKSYLIIAGLCWIYSIYQEFSSGTRVELVFAMSLALIPAFALYIYILFLPFLLFRRWRDKQRGIMPLSISEPKSAKKKNASIAIVVITVLISFVVLGAVSDSRQTQIETFLINQKEVSRVLGEYNSAAGAAVGVVRGISDGTLTAGEGISEFAVAGSKVTPVLSELRSVCADIKFPEIEGEGQELALAKAMNMLRVACEVTPRQFLTLQQIFQEQISDTGTQARLDQLSVQLEALNQQKIDAAIVGLEAILPYADEADAQFLKSMLQGFKNR